ncbi:MAG: acylneuraminate cytidylyltransferase family protein [Anaerolineales bacterium]|nr:acylneuraminate cytidylyltransferase family protein [Anaerolineales bacterium]
MGIHSEIPAIAALVPMKWHSERVPGKNIRPLCGKPLFHWILGALSDCRYVDQIVIDTDSPQIAEEAYAHFDVRIIERPDHLIGDMFVANDLIEYDITQLNEFDFFLQTHSTNPLLKSSTIDAAIEAFFSQSVHDTLLTVTALQTRLYRPDGSPLNHDPHKLIRTQDLEPLYEENSCLYIFSRESFLKNTNRIGERPMLYEMDAAEAWDIDEELDFQIADFLMRFRYEDGT